MEADDKRQRCQYLMFYKFRVGWKYLNSFSLLKRQFGVTDRREQVPKKQSLAINFHPNYAY